MGCLKLEYITSTENQIRTNLSIIRSCDEESNYADIYRYGFNGMEKDDELKGEGNSYDFGARIYDSRLGRWLTIDPLTGKQPDQSPYKAMLNNPMLFKDPDGRTEYLTTIVNNKQTGESMTITVAVSNDLEASHTYANGMVHYSDFTKTETYTIEEDGSVSYSMGESRSTGTVKGSAPMFVPESVAKLFINGAEGAGDEQNGGYSLTSESGGVSSTKTISLSDPSYADVGEFLTALKGLRKLKTLGGLKGVATPMSVDLGNGVIQNGYDGFRKIMDVIKETGLKPGTTENGGVPNSESYTTTSTGDINNEKPGDIITTKIPYEGKTIEKRDSVHKERNSGGHLIKSSKVTVK